MLDQIAALFGLSSPREWPTRRHIRGLFAIAVLMGVCGLGILLIPGVPHASVGHRFAPLQRVETYIGITLGVLIAVAINRRPRRTNSPSRSFGYLASVVGVMLIQPLRFLGVWAMALYAGMISGATLWLAAFTLTLAALDRRAWREAGSIDPPHSRGSATLSHAPEEIDFWDRD
jgi:hypothetical protein